MSMRIKKRVGDLESTNDFDTNHLRFALLLSLTDPVIMYAVIIFARVCAKYHLSLFHHQQPLLAHRLVTERRERKMCDSQPVVTGQKRVVAGDQEGKA